MATEFGIALYNLLQICNSLKMLGVISNIMKTNLFYHHCIKCTLLVSDKFAHRLLTTFMLCSRGEGIN